MPILQDVPIALTAEQVATAQGRRAVRPEILRDAQAAVDLGATLWQPRSVYDWFDVQAVENERVRLALPGDGREAVLHVGPKADLLGGARRVLVAVSTIGPALERRVHALQETGEPVASYLLDTAGVLALGAVGAALRCLVEDTAAGLGWGVSEALAPGSLFGWQLRGQRELCALLPLETIGVVLNDYCVLEPHKSTSVAIGLGPGYAAARVGSVCRFCALRGTCWRRREDPS